MFLHLSILPASIVTKLFTPGQSVYDDLSGGVHEITCVTIDVRRRTVCPPNFLKFYGILENVQGFASKFARHFGFSCALITRCVLIVRREAYGLSDTLSLFG